MTDFQINSLTSGVLVHTAQLAYVEEAAGTHALLELFSDIFRYITRGRRSIALSEELLILGKYLHLQSLRFPGRFEADICSMKEDEECYLPAGGLIGFVDEILSSSLDSLEGLFNLQIASSGSGCRSFEVHVSHRTGKNVYQCKLPAEDDLNS